MSFALKFTRTLYVSTQKSIALANIYIERDVRVYELGQLTDY